MTITYSLDVANTRFCGFTKLLYKWKGSIYKILWRELLCFCVAYSLLSVTYRCFLNTTQKKLFEKIVVYCESFIDLIPLSFVLGFYVSLVIGRWWNQFDAIPWPDRTCLLIGTFVHGADERSRTIRRTLGRYLILMQIFTFQGVSTAVKKRFPSIEHVEASGLITNEERMIYEKMHIPYGKWWLPAHWFCSLAMRARKEGRIKDSVMLKTLIKEFLNYRSACGTMFNYDWISVPLVYTQVVTLATYTYSLSLLMGRQYLDPDGGFKKHEVDLYVPIFTMLQFFFYVGWLKVAEQLVNPYGEDDDDFELNWCLDRSAQIVYLLVDHFHTKHPKLRRDHFWDEFEPQLPHTKFTAKNLTNPQLGSAVNLEIDPTKTDFLPMETLLEEDDDENDYDSVGRKPGRSIRYRPSILMKILSGGIGHSFRRNSAKKVESFKDISVQGIANPAFTQNRLRSRKGSSVTPPRSRSSSNAGRKTSSPAHSRTSSISFRQSSINRHRHKHYDLQQAETTNQSGNKALPDMDPSSGVTSLSLTRTSAAAIAKDLEEETQCEQAYYEQTPNNSNELTEQDNVAHKMAEGPMPPIPEEPSRPPSMAFLDSSTESYTANADKKDEVHELVLEANKVLEELNRAVTARGHKSECKQLGYESCCSLGSDETDQDEEEEGETMFDGDKGGRGSMLPNDNTDDLSIVVDSIVNIDVIERL